MVERGVEHQITQAVKKDLMLCDGARCVSLMMMMMMMDGSDALLKTLPRFGGIALE